MNVQTLPRYPQRFSDLPEWETPAEVSDKIAYKWEQRSCGVACLRSLLDYYGRPVPSQWSLIDEARSINAFSRKGLIHSKLIALAEKHGLSGMALKIDSEFDVFNLSRSAHIPLIISVKHKLPDDAPKSGGHLVVVKAIESPDTILLSDPSHWGKDHPSLPVSNFSSYSGRAIAIAPSSTISRITEGTQGILL